jgi:uncharacterized protein YbjT (DUF2867 family)
MKGVALVVAVALAVAGWTGLALADAESQVSLATLIERLQRTPGDDTLRAKVIHVARATEPAPLMPVEALRHQGAGQGYFKGAVTPEGYLRAAREYEQALRLAPWAAPLYYGLAESYEKMSDAELENVAGSTPAGSSCALDDQERERHRFDGYDQARRNFEFYLLASTDLSEQEVALTRRRIVERAFRLEQWRYQWNRRCCLGCGGKQDSVR